MTSADVAAHLTAELEFFDAVTDVSGQLYSYPKVDPNWMRILFFGGGGLYRWGLGLVRSITALGSASSDPGFHTIPPPCRPSHHPISMPSLPRFFLSFFLPLPRRAGRAQARRCGDHGAAQVASGRSLHAHPAPEQAEGHKGRERYPHAGGWVVEVGVKSLGMWGGGVHVI